MLTDINYFTNSAVKTPCSQEGSPSLPHTDGNTSFDGNTGTVRVLREASHRLNALVAEGKLELVPFAPEQYAPSTTQQSGPYVGQQLCSSSMVSPAYVGERSIGRCRPAPYTAPPPWTTSGRLRTHFNDSIDERYESDVQIAMPCHRDVVASPAGNLHVGAFVNGQKFGMGFCHYDVNSCIYEGQFKNLLWHGKGTVTFNDSSEYEGQFKDGKAHGTGRYIDDCDRVLYEGKWINGRPADPALCDTVICDPSLGR